MDPVGPWYVSYNRLVPTNTAGTFQTATLNANADLVTHHLAQAVAQSVPCATTQPQLIIQAAHTNATVGTQPATFNTQFLSTPQVAYDVFTPLFHSTAKQINYIPQRQTIAQAQVVAAPKINSQLEQEIPVIRASYATPQQTESTYFETQGAGNNPGATVVPWPQQTSAQLSSPFGVLPHESLVPATLSTATAKTNNVPYSNSFSSNLSSVQPLSNAISQITLPIGTVEFKTLGYTDQLQNKLDPSSLKSITTEALATTNQTFFQPSTTFDATSLANNFTNDSNDQSLNATNNLLSSSCIVSSSQNSQNRASVDISNRSPTTFQSAPPVRINSQAEKLLTHNSNFTSPPTKTPPTNHSESNHVVQEVIHENCQSSPLSFTAMDSTTLGFNTSSSQSKQSNGGSYHLINQQQSQQQQSSYRQFSSGSTSDTEYHHSGRSKSTASTDSAYSSNTSQNGPDCAVVIPRRPSPLQGHSQASPLGHVPSPAYPMYNSPMAMSSPSPLQHTEGNNNQCSGTTPFKTNVQQPQMTPPSPMEVSVPRPSSQGQVGYPSVITRALASSNSKTSFDNEANSYDSHTDFQPQKQSVCWESNGPSDQSKYSVSSYNSPESGVVEITVSSLASPNSRILNIPDRQSYYETETINLQDLSSCRGDPMSIIKNLQSIQHHSSGSSACQVDQHSMSKHSHNSHHGDSDSHKTEYISKKKMFLDKCALNQNSSLHNLDASSSSTVSDYLNRVPPPAHHNVNQQQNSFFDFDRWTFPSTPTKSFASSSPSPYSSPSNLLASTAYMANSPQLQSAMNHHHQAAGVTAAAAFYNNFHDFNSTMDIGSLSHYGTENSCSPSQTYGHQNHVVRDDSRPKVIVPDIEEELGFLQQQNVASNTNRDQANHQQQQQQSSDPNSGFMTSFLKFLQGDKDPSPPPAMRNARKAPSWKKALSTPEPVVAKSVVPEKPMVVATAKNNSSTNNIDYTNDPRYFPLPKVRKNSRIESSDDGFSSEEESVVPVKPIEKAKPASNKPRIVASITIKKPDIKPMRRAGRGTADKKRRMTSDGQPSAVINGDVTAVLKTKKLLTSETNVQNNKVDEWSKKHRDKKKNATPTTRRQTSKRKAKGKASEVLPEKSIGEVAEGDRDDSDVDPGWISVKEDDKRKRRAGRGGPGPKKRKGLDAIDFEAQQQQPRKGGRKKRSLGEGTNKNSKLFCKIDEKLLASVSDDDIDISPYKTSSKGDSKEPSGDFVVIKSDLSLEHPPLWRIDGKTLLQKYEPFKNKDGKVLYRNISTYSGWATQNRLLYQQVPVKFWQQTKQETIVEFLRDEMIADNSETVVKFMKESEKYQDNFEVYIQTLISQALDSNFLTEIFQEQDDYFLSNVRAVDEITEEKKLKLLASTSWSDTLVQALTIWPCVNILHDVPASDFKGKTCAGCSQPRLHARILLYGQPYNLTTLEGSPIDPKVPQDKDFVFCRTCQRKVDWFNKVTHQKYIMFLECARRVADKKVADPHKDTTVILNELLADELWLNQLFREVRSIWAEIDSLKKIQPHNSQAQEKTALQNARIASIDNVDGLRNDPWKSLLHETCSSVDL